MITVLYNISICRIDIECQLKIDYEHLINIDFKFDDGITIKPIILVNIAGYFVVFLGFSS